MSKSTSLTCAVTEDIVFGSAAGSDIVVALAPLDNCRSSAIHDDVVFAGTAAKLNGCPDSRTDFDLIVSAATISNNRGDTAEILAAPERFNLQNFTGVIRVVPQPIDSDPFVHFVWIDISETGTAADVDMKFPLSLITI